MIVESKIEKTCPEHDTEGAKILRVTHREGRIGIALALSRQLS